MAYFEDEVPKSLELDEMYSSREIYLFMLENRNVIILSGSTHLNHHDNEKRYRVVDIKENYVHKTADDSSRTHRIPSTKTKIYEIR
ncbi:hypothetical protein [Planomicrobium sp. CPCC 101079]|uniref:hypothetical protein n=1 Tax=Planomicrobium sp. CPCC 101079 TaxID=2599618 RepID=UPI0011B5FE2F|nr:hypothetical protein [Planomicrobium sp. CPCC 101079]TWT04616.1 hypothetical protein FQV28_08410 [Planomicrobium sp. CPCC 101079]